MNRSIFYIACLLAVGSCVEPIIMDSHEDLPVAVYCVLKESDTQTLELFYTKSKSQSDYIPISDAEVALYHDNEKVADFSYNGSLWEADFRPNCGETYILNIQIPGKEMISAKTTMPLDFTAFCFYHYHTQKVAVLADLPSYCFSVSFELRVLHQSPSHPDMYGTPFDDKCNLWIFPLSQWIYFDSDYVYNELITTDHPNADLFNQTGITLKDLPCYQEESYSKFSQLYRLFLLWMPEYIPDLPMCRNFVHIKHPAFFNNHQDVSEESTIHYSTSSFLLSTNYVTENEIRVNHSGISHGPLLPYQTYYEFISVSDELDNYLRDLYIKDLNRDNMSILYSTDNVYSNVNNGLGIFGSEIHRINLSTSGGYRRQ